MPSRYKFTNPPINELVCGVHFTTFDIPLFQITSEFFQKIQSEFPQLEEKLPLIQGFEKEKNIFPPLKYHFINEMGDKLIQFQNGKYFFNWRRKEESPYPSFDKIYTDFKKYWLVIDEIFKNKDYNLAVNNLEITYVDFIPPEELSELLSLFSDKIKIFENPKYSILVNQEISQCNGTYSLQLKSAELSQEKKDVVVLQSTIRGDLVDTIDVDEWFTRAHDKISEIFLEIITEFAKTKWGYIDDSSN